MIKVNLVTGKKPFEMPVVLGIDLKHLNLRAFLLALVVYALGNTLIPSQFKSEVQAEQAKVDAARKQIAKLKREKRPLLDAQKQMKELEEQEKDLNKKLVVVKKILKIKKNPTKVLHYVAANIPKNVWLNDISIKNDVLEISGESTNYKEIGVFLSALRKSVFFDQSLRLVNSGTNKDARSGTRTEMFNITGNLVKFE